MFSIEEKDIIKAWAKIIGILFILSCAIMVLSPYANAAQSFNATINATDITEHTITWSYNYSIVLKSASLDGVSIPDFDTNSHQFTANDLTPNSSHTLCGYSTAGLSLCETTKTLPEIIIPTNQENFFAFVMAWIIFLAGLACCIVGISVDFVGFGGALFGFIGIISEVNGSFTNALLFLILICAGIFVGFKGGNQ
jgi:hypothetical protein